MRLKVTITLAAAALLGGLAACNNELDEPRADQVPENAVRITAGIANPFAATRSMPTGTAEEQTKFKAGDEILVVTQTHGYTVYRFDGKDWTPKDGKYLLWKKDTDTFRAQYPAELGLAQLGYGTFEFPKDQRTKENIAKADCMWRQLANVKKTKEALHFEMQRHSVRIIVKIAAFNYEFPAGTRVKDVKFNIKPTPNMPLEEYIPYTDDNGGKGSTYTAVISTGDAGSTVTLSVGDKTMTSKLQTENGRFSPGKSYTFNLTVGKEKLELGEVTVADWTGSATIPGGEAMSQWDGVSTSPVTPEADGKTYNIKEPEEWVWLCEQVGNKTISTKGLIVNLTADLNFGGYEMYPLGYTKGDENGTAVGFWGTLNGNNHTIKELKMTQSAYRHIGFIARLFPNSTVKDLTVECDIKGNCGDTGSEAVTIGGMAGNCMGGTMQNCTVKGTVSSDKIAVYMGGVVGYFYGGTMIKCSNYAEVVFLSDDHRVTGGVAGGVADLLLTGYDIPSFMIACINYGTLSVRGDGRAGGIAGESTYSVNKPNDVRSTFVACYNVGATKVVEGATYTGQATGLCTVPAEKNAELYGCFSAGVLPQNGNPGVTFSKPYGNGIFALSDASDELPASVGIADTGINCGKKTQADLNSPETVKAMNDAIEAFNAKEPAHACTYRFKVGPTYPVLE